MQTTINTTANTTTAATAICVTAFIAPQSFIDIYGAAPSNAPAIITVGTYMSDRSISRICNFNNAANALSYAFILKSENCPISKNAFALLQAEIKRTGAVSNRAKARAEAKAKAEAEAKAEPQPEPEPQEAKPKKAAKGTSIKPTALQKQYEEMKKKHPDAILLFRVGDFYECLGEDAVAAADILSITLTRRANGKNKSIELAGFPHHALDTYLPKLVRAGRRVAICEQLEEPKAAK